MMREIKYRQYIKATDKFHCWGLVGDGFIMPTFDVNGDYYPSEQFTGLHDSRGKEIWEGDYVRDTNGEMFSVYYQDGSFYYGTVNLTEKNIKRDYLKVVGTIHENQNPELLGMVK